MLLGLAPFAVLEGGERSCAACGRVCGWRGAVPHVLFECPALAGPREGLRRKFHLEMAARELRNEDIRASKGEAAVEAVIEWGSVAILAACPGLVIDAIEGIVQARVE